MKPLIMWVAEAAAKSKTIDRVWITTDSRKIESAVCFWNISNKICVRFVDKISDTALQEETLIPFAEEIEFDHVMLMQATTPYTTSQDIDEAFKKYFEGQYDSLVSVCRQHRFIWQVLDNGEAHPINYDPMHRTRRQDWGGLLIENGAFFITSREALLKSRNRISGRTGIYEMSAESYFEIDDETDWIIAEQLIKRRECNV